MSIDPRRAFLLAVVKEYVQQPAAFLDRWHNPPLRRQMLLALASAVGQDEQQLEAMVLEDEATLRRLGQGLVKDVGDELFSNPARYAGNRLYIESVSPSRVKAGVEVTITAQIYAYVRPTVSVAQGLDTWPMTVRGKARRWVAEGKVTLATGPAMLHAVATSRDGTEEKDAFPDAIVAE